MNSYTQKCQPAKKFISEMEKGGLLVSGGSWKSQEYIIRSLWYLILGKPLKKNTKQKFQTAALVPFLV